MHFSDEFIAELKERIRPSEFIGRRVKLRRQGREWVGLSPFKAERTPSFFVNDTKRFWHDFASGRSGDVIRFLMETERLGFVEAVAQLAQHAGMTMPVREARPEVEARNDRNQQLLALVEAAAAFFEASLRRPEGAEARAYLHGRGLDERAWTQFRIGYAPPGPTALKAHLARHSGARDDDLLQALLLTQDEERTRAPWDRFRNRVMFPITDARGKVRGFGGRVLAADQKPKYLNSPDGDIFHKGELLYRLPEARRRSAGPAGGPIVVCEGYLDVVAMERAGLAAVAPMGTALTEAQLNLLWRAGGTPVLCFDGDAAGRRAAWRALDVALPMLRPEHTLRFVFLPDGLDPDDFVRARGATEMHELVRTAHPLAQVLFDRERDAEPLDTPEARTGLYRRLRAAARRIADPELAAAYGEELVRRAQGHLASIAPPVRPTGGDPRWRGRPGGPRREGPSMGWRPNWGAQDGLTDEARALARSALSVADARAQNLLQRILRWPPVLDHSVEDIAQLPIDNPDLDAIRHALLDAHAEGATLDADRIGTHLRQSGKLRAVDRLASWDFFLRPDADESTDETVDSVGVEGAGARDRRKPFDPAAFEAEWFSLLDLCRLGSLTSHDRELDEPGGDPAPEAADGGHRGIGLRDNGESLSHDGEHPGSSGPAREGDDPEALAFRRAEAEVRARLLERRRAFMRRDGSG
jgi:DNA primase